MEISINILNLTGQHKGGVKYICMYIKYDTDYVTEPVTIYECVYKSTSTCVICSLVYSYRGNIPFKDSTL